ncbi:alpha/beta fold hydrolase [Thermomonospora umbrina]|uniref:Pimeloyl-ACP methyl ester carboxylesterase n=1 Tax=Thermomonospora umbrina TaxID=111806 RepID=A0A3D9T3S0_9ACTN|nr:alpha/beta fold hydrolase [Thermomonospora umbrina]REE99895.1 pimeloyl-ACP methyl ester carboxylesterase [Thermomonospora umbrina]
MTTEHGIDGRRITSFERNGLVFDVVDQGPLDGDVVVLLHGFPQTASSWDALAPLLHESGYRTLAPCQRGYAPRARPRGRFAYRMSQLVDDVLALIETARPGGGKVHVVGHDWGAAVAWTLAANRPDVVATVTALSVPHPAAFMWSLFTGRQFLMSWYMYAFQIPWLPELVVRRLHRRARTRLIEGVAAGGQTKANAARDADHLVNSGALTPALNWYRGMPFNSPRGLARVTVPALYIWSDKDPALSRKGAERTRRFVTGPYTFHTLTGVGHWIPEQAPQEVAELLRPHLVR